MQAYLRLSSGYPKMGVAVRTEYIPRKYYYEDMIYSFQSDLVEPEEQINAEAFIRSCLNSERNSLYFDMHNEEEIRKFIKIANTFDARLIGVINEWAEAEDKAYARDGILLDGKTASQIMWEKGCSFIDVVCMTQKALDDPQHSPIKKIQISIGGPAFMTSENILNTVKEKGQINKGNRKKSDLGRMEPNAHQSTLQSKSRSNREYLLAEQEEYKKLTDGRSRLEREYLEELIEKEEQALQLFDERTEKGIKPGEFTATFYMLGRDGEVHEKVTSNATIAEHKAQLEALSKADEHRKHALNDKTRERINLKDLEEMSDSKNSKRQVHKPKQKEPELKRVRKEPSLKRDGLQK